MCHVNDITGLETLFVAMFDAAARHAQILQQGYAAARQAELILRNRRVLSLSLPEWREYLLLFFQEVVEFVDKLQQQPDPVPWQVSWSWWRSVHRSSVTWKIFFSVAGAGSKAGRSLRYSCRSARVRSASHKFAGCVCSSCSPYRVAAPCSRFCFCRAVSFEPDLQ